MCSPPIGPFAPIALSADALIKRLKEAGIDPLLALWQTSSPSLACQLEGLLACCTLAPFARRRLAIDAHHLGCRAAPSQGRAVDTGRGWAFTRRFLRKGGE